MNIVQEVIKSSNKEDGPKSYVLTFLFLLGYEMAQIDKKQNELAEEMSMNPRTLREHLYRLKEQGYIDYEYDRDGTHIEILKFEFHLNPTA